MARQFTRATLHELVWSKPVSHVAKEFALSDVAIHKICRKHGIPTPPLGWWAKQQAGKPVDITPLPTLDEDIADQVIIAAPELRAEDDAVAQAREAARVRVSGFDAASVGADPCVTRTIATLRRAKPSPKGLLNVTDPKCISCEVSADALERLELILSRCAAAARLQGFVLEPGPNQVHFAGDGETVSLRVEEIIHRVKHVLTPAELKSQQAWEADQARRAKRASWDWRDDWRPSPRTPDWDYVATGQLSLTLSRVYVRDGQSPRHSFRDGKVQRLDLLAPDISVALVALAAAKARAREQAIQAEQAREEARRVRELPLRAKHIAQRRSETLEALLAELADLNRLRQLLHGLDIPASSDPRSRLATFVAFAHDELASRAQQLAGPALEARFEQLRVFGPDDDHGFKGPLWF